MRIDEQGMRGLMEAAEDLQSDGMRRLRPALDEAVDKGLERRARGEVDEGRRVFLKTSLVTAGIVGTGAGAALLRAGVPVFADQSTDVMSLQTAAALENLAVSVYNKAAGLPPQTSGAANPVILSFVKMAIKHHTDHAQSFNAAVQKLNGKPQMGVDAVVNEKVVTPALAQIKGPGDVVALAQTLEDAAAQTYVKFGSEAGSKDVISAFAAVAPVEAQHSGILLAVKALLDAGLAAAITQPPDATKLPGAAGSVGFPNSFYKTDAARPANEATVS